MMLGARKRTDMDRIVLHMDMDAFFASVEECDKPWLKGKPIVVGADPKGGEGRGVVSTANYAARKYGIRSALPISTAWRLSEEAKRRGEEPAVFVGGNHKRYAEVSRAIMGYLRSVAEAVEEASVDEAYFELQSAKRESQSADDMWQYTEAKAREIKEHIRKTQGLTCSIGIGPNKLIAKMASGMEKPDGLTVVRPEGVQEFLDPQPVQAIPGIGPKSAAVFERMWVRTIRDLRGLSEAELMERFGKWGNGMYRKARGIDDAPVVAEHEVKSIGEQETYEKDTLDPVFLTGRLKELARQVYARVKRGGFAGFRTVSITVRFADFETKTRAHTTSVLAAGAKNIETEAFQLFLPFLDKRENPRKKLIRLLGVRAEKLLEKKRADQRRSARGR